MDEESCVKAVVNRALLGDEMELTYIYAHLLPFEAEIFYIGKSDDPWDRLAGHLQDAKTGEYYQARKIRSLVAQGLVPRIEIIAEVPVEEWKFWERHYIKYFRDLGFRLTNATDGGDGFGYGIENPSYGKRGPLSPWFGISPPRKAIEASAATRTGKPLTPEHCAKLSAIRSGEGNPMYGKRGELSPQFGRVRSPEEIEKSRQGRIGQKRTPEQRERMRQGQLRLEKKLSPETIAKRTTTSKKNRELKKSLGL